MAVKQFQKVVLDFYRKHARRDLPWRGTCDPWAILVSEVMLQQTQVARVQERFADFLRSFPTPKHLARASTKKVLRAWQGLGYNRRALNLQRAARLIMTSFRGQVPSDPSVLEFLPGIGLYTANAVVAFAFNKPVVFLDTNIRRVYIHHFFNPRFTQRHPEGNSGSRNKKQKTKNSFDFSFPFWIPGQARNDGEAWARKIQDKEILPLIGKTLYRRNPRLWYWALMDYGALGEFGENPNLKSRRYTRQSKFLGSRRFVRAKIVSFLLASRSPMGVGEIQEHLQNFIGIGKWGRSQEVKGILKELEQEGFLERKNKRWFITK